MLEGWQIEVYDAARARRLFAGACLGAALLGLLGFAATRAKAAPPPPPEPEEEDIPVALVESPEEPPPEPPAEAPRDTAPAAPGPRRAPPAASPTKVPDGAKQADPGDDMYGNAAPDPSLATGGGSGSGSGGAPKLPPPPPPPPPPSPKPKAAPAAEGYEPPKCKLRAPNRSQAKAIGVEGTVVVKYTVTESGAITNPTVVSGPPELSSLALAAITGSSCSPALKKSDGSPVSVTRTVKYPIRFTSN